MSFKMISKVMETHFDSPSEKLVMLVMANFFDDKKAKCWPSYEVLAEITGFNKRTIIRVVDGLVSKGFLRKGQEPTRRGSKRVKNYYVIDFPEDCESVTQDHQYGDRMSPNGDRMSPNGDRMSPATVTQDHPILLVDTVKEPVKETIIPLTPKGERGTICPSSKKRKTKEERQQEERDTRAVIDAYNRIFDGLLPQAEYDKELRGKIIRFREDYLKDKSITGFIAYFEAFKNTASDFYFGNGFTATLDFLLKPKTLRNTRAGAL
ncbi:helix-turn-helix domain-containing protein [Escherichia coli]|nr:helix-turn-helix domain-containing protein [Escherichia coli]